LWRLLPPEPSRSVRRVLIQENSIQCAAENNGVYGGNVQVTAISENYNLLISAYFVPGGQITETPTFVFGHVKSERSVRKQTLGIFT
jgi:hypothetical protein